MTLNAHPIATLTHPDIPAVVGRAPYGSGACSSVMELYQADGVYLLQQRAPPDHGASLNTHSDLAKWAAAAGVSTALCLGDVDGGTAARGAASGLPVRHWPPNGPCADRIAAAAPPADAELFGPLPPDERHLGPWPLARELDDANVRALALAAINRRGDEPAHTAKALAEVALAAAGLPPPPADAWRAPPSWAHYL